MTVMIFVTQKHFLKRSRNFRPSPWILPEAANVAALRRLRLSFDMGIPQGSVIAPISFNIIIHDLPKALLNNSHVAQYAHDIAIWVNTTLRKYTNKRVVSIVQKLYQSEMNKLTAYVKDNGFELSRDKMCLMLFKNGENPKSLPQIDDDDDEVMLNVLRCQLAY